MRRRRFKVTEPMLFSWLLLIGLAFLFAPASVSERLQLGFVRIFSKPISVAAHLPRITQPKSASAETVPREKYNELQNYLANVTQELVRERSKVKKLSRIHNRRPLEAAQLVYAGVITKGSSSYADELIINRGRADGLKKGQYVMSRNSIVGLVSDVFQTTARNVLGTNPDMRMAVQVVGTDAERLMQGTGRGHSRIMLLSTNYKVSEGDAVYACCRPGYLDAPMITGRIKRLYRDPDNPLIWDVTVEPACDMSRIDYVFVIKMPENVQSR